MNVCGNEYFISRTKRGRAEVCSFCKSWEKQIWMSMEKGRKTGKKLGNRWGKDLQALAKHLDCILVVSGNYETSAWRCWNDGGGGGGGDHGEVCKCYTAGTRPGFLVIKWSQTTSPPPGHSWWLNDMACKALDIMLNKSYYNYYCDHQGPGYLCSPSWPHLSPKYILNTNILITIMLTSINVCGGSIFLANSIKPI